MPKHVGTQNRLEPQEVNDEKQADEELQSLDGQSDEEVPDFFANPEQIGLPAKNCQQASQQEYQQHLTNVVKNLARIQTHEEKIISIRKNYGEIISKIAENPSNLTKLAKAYSDMHMAAKVGTGALVAVSPFTLLVFIGAAAATTSAFGILAVYTTVGLLLDEHTNSSKPEKLKEGIEEVVGVLQDTIKIFDDISVELSTGVDGLNKEVDRLNGVVTGLNTIVDKLNGSIGELTGEVSVLQEQLAVMQTVSAEFEKEASNFKIENEALKVSSLELREANNRFSELNDQYLDRNIAQDEIIEQHKKLLEQYTCSQGKLEAKLKEVQDELAVRQASFEALFEAQMQQQNLSAEQIKEETQKFTLNLERINKAAKIEFKDLQQQISTSSQQLLQSHEVQEKLQSELSQSVEKLAVREREFKTLKNEYSIEIEKLREQISILTGHNQSLESGKDQVYSSLAQVYAVGRSELATGGGWMPNLFKSRSSDKALPVANLVDDASEDKGVNSRWNNQITI